MIKLTVRIIISVLIAVLLAMLGIVGNSAVLQTLFTVLGIVFSISMSLLVSFSMSKIVNKSIRKNLRYKITHTRNMLLVDFGVSTLCLVVALIWNEDKLIYHISFCTLDIMLIGLVLVAVSLMYEINNFRRLHKLHSDIEDAIISETSN